MSLIALLCHRLAFMLTLELADHTKILLSRITKCSAFRGVTHHIVTDCLAREIEQVSAMLCCLDRPVNLPSKTQTLFINEKLCHLEMKLFSVLPFIPWLL